MEVAQRPNSNDEARDAKSFLFAGGGTGGHLAPGIAVAEALKHRDSNVRCVFVGAGRTIEQRMLNGTPFESVGLPVRPLNALKRQPLEFLRGNLSALRAAWQLIRNHRPTAVIGLGGYASVPVVMAAAIHRVPVWLLEQNAIPGRANRWLSHWFPICITFASSRFWLPFKAQVFVTGNPLRQQLVSVSQTSNLSPSLRPPTLLVMGGSQGSTGVNCAVLAVVAQLQPELKEWHIIHQTGEAQCEAVRSSYAQLGIKADVQSFFNNVDQLYRESRFIICRAGATTLTELAMAGLPAILIPYPHSADQHQVENASVFTTAGAAITVLERETRTTQQELQTAIASLLRDSLRLDAMSSAMQTLANPTAANDVAELISPRN